MATLQELMLRAQLLRQETAVDSISPERAGSIMYDTLAYINQMQLQDANPLLISKIYASVAAMEADSAPVSDLTGQPLRPGQVVCIVPDDETDPDYGMIYRYDGTTGGTSIWTAVGRIGSIPYLEGYQFVSVATLTPIATDPGTPTQKVFYLASEPGIYTNFGGIVVNSGEVVNLKFDGSSWSKEVTGAASLESLSEQATTEFVDIINNSNFTDATKWRPVNASVANIGSGEFALTHSSASAQYCRIEWRSKIGSAFVAGHVYFAIADVYCDNDAIVRFYIGNGFDGFNIFPGGRWCSVGGLVAATQDAEVSMNFSKLYYTPQGDVFKFKNFRLFDVTEALGATTFDNLLEHRLSNYLTNYLPGLVGGNIDKAVFLGNNGCVTIAGANSIYKREADFVCDGRDDQVLINEVIQNPAITKIIFTSDSVFNISAQINLKSGLEIISHGAKFENNLDTFYNFSLASAVQVGDTEAIITPSSCDLLREGAYIEIISGYDSSLWATAFVSSISYSSGKCSLDVTSFPKIKGIDDPMPAGSIVRNVSSCFSGNGVENVKISGITIDWNYPANARCPETFWAQNGMHFYNCDNITIENCSIKNGGRHGILTYYSRNVQIVRCECLGWGEHGIDLYDSQYADPRATYNVVDGCVCMNNAMCGIQAHSGSRCRIVNNYCAGNQIAGIHQQQTKDNVIANNICENNYHGIRIRSTCESIVVNGNMCLQSTRCGIEIDVTGSDIAIIGNIIKGCGWYGIYGTTMSRSNISGNKIETVSLAGIRIANSQKNSVAGNMIDCGGAVPALVETDGADYTIVRENVLISPTTDVSLIGSNSISANNLVL